MFAALRKLMSTAAAPSPAASTARIREICDWYGSVIAEENAYFSAADKAIEDSRKAAQIRADKLATTLRDGIPTAEDFAALAETRQLLDNMRTLSVQSPFWSRAQAVTRRQGMNPEAKANAIELVGLARAFIEKPLADAIKADAELTEKLEAKEPVCTRRQRDLAEISDSITLTASELVSTADTPQWWAPLSGLVAGLETELAR